MIYSVLLKVYEHRSWFIGYVNTLAVFKEHRRMGIGRDLLVNLHQKMAEHYQIDNISLDCSVENSPAIEMYQSSLKYQLLKRIPDYYGHRKDAWIMNLPSLALSLQF